MTSVDSADLDTAKLLEIMKGASREPGDPDIELAIIISRLVDAEEAAPYQAVLQQLIRDAHPD
jgi:hypothetical protein